MIGERFIVNSTREWVGPEGEGVQHERFLVEVTAEDEYNATWRVVEILSVEGAPTKDANLIQVGGTGGFAKRFLAELIEAGSYERTETA